MIGTARSRWSVLHSRRSGVLKRARDCADLTIPALLPPENTSENDELPTPYQSLGSRGVNHLANKIVLALFPSSTAFFRFRLREDIREAFGASIGQVDEAMRQLEQRGMRKMEEGNLRSLQTVVAKHLIVTGNVCLHAPPNGASRIYRLDQFCVVRDPRGRVIEAVIKEVISPLSLTDEEKLAVQIDADAEPDKDIDLYTHISRVEKGRYEWHQEINGIQLPNSEGRAKEENLPYLFLRWSDAGGGDYGRGMIEEYLGDLRSLEGLSKAIVQFSALASKIIFLVAPNASTSTAQLAAATNGSFVSGNPQDIHALQLEKYADFQVAKAVIDELSLRLSHAFLLPSGTIRDAERVTAEEIRAMAQELEDVLGGVYSVLAQEWQLPLVRHIISRLKSEGEYPKMPGGSKALEPVIITGFDALGRGHELNRYRGFVADVAQTFGPEVAQRYLKVSAGIQKFATGHNIEQAELVKSEDEVRAEIQQEQQQAMMADLASKAAGPAVNQLGNIATTAQQGGA